MTLALAAAILVGGLSACVGGGPLSTDQPGGGQQSGAATAEASVYATATALAVTRASSEPASTAIRTYAQQVLGVTVTVAKAGSLSGDVQRLLKLPPAGVAAQSATVSVAAVSYGAVFDGGAASLSYGRGTLSGDLNQDLNRASLGAFSFDSTETPTSADAALKLALQTFPGLASQSFSPFSTATGYAWSAQAASPVAQKVLLAVMPAGAGRWAASAVVGQGDFAAAVFP